MNYYPIVIPTLCRFEHFKRCIESLSQNTHADRTELIIGLDYPSKMEHWEGYNKIKEYISTINAFKGIICFERKENYGAEKNTNDIVCYAFEKYDALILSEDDKEFSPCFLDFMNKTLYKYKYEKKITSVCGYTAFDFENIKENGVLFTHDNCAWGMGIWKHKETEVNNMEFYECLWKSTCQFWTLFLKAPAITTMFTTMMQKQAKWGDIMRSVRNIKNETFQVRPYISLVRNWGYDGSGLHCTSIDEKMKEQKILNNTIFTLNQDEKIKNSLTYFAEFFFHKPSQFTKAIMSIMRNAYFCLKIRHNLL